MNYASPKNILLILLAIVIIGGALVFSKYRNVQTTVAQNENVISTITSSVATSSQQLINYTGDWQKTLSTQATPSSWSAPASASVSSANTPLTATDIFSRNLFAQYVSAKQAGRDTSDPQVQADIAAQVMSDGALLSAAKTYNKSSVKIGTDNSSASLKQYGNDVGNIFKSNLDTTQRSELAIVQESLTKSDSSVLKELDPIIASYTKIINGLLAMRVPPAMVDFHIAVLNAVSNIIFADQGFTKTFSDGIASIQGLGLYQNALGQLNDALTNVAKYFILVKISFVPSDSGSIFIIPSSSTQTQ